MPVLQNQLIVNYDPQAKLKLHNYQLAVMAYPLQSALLTSTTYKILTLTNSVKG
jgi:hypothetical protein